MTGVRRLIVWLGGLALLAAAFVDTVSVIGRHIGLPLRGAIELIQAAVLVSGSIALVFATLHASHARVGLVLDRLPGPARRVGEFSCSIAVAVAFSLLLVGSVWIAIDLWGGHERSELLGVPWWAMRLFANACLLIAALAALRQKKVSRS